MQVKKPLPLSVGRVSEMILKALFGDGCTVLLSVHHHGVAADAKLTRGSDLNRR